MPRPRGRPPKPERVPVIKETYRGEEIEAIYGELHKARAAVDRKWAMRLAAAPDKWAREAILAEERAITKARRGPPLPNSIRWP